MPILFEQRENGGLINPASRLQDVVGPKRQLVVPEFSCPLYAFLHQTRTDACSSSAAWTRSRNWRERKAARLARLFSESPRGLIQGRLDQQTPAERDATCQTIVEKMMPSIWIRSASWILGPLMGACLNGIAYNGTPTATTKRLFEGIELRLEAPTNHRLSTLMCYLMMPSFPRL